MPVPDLWEDLSDDRMIIDVWHPGRADSPSDIQLRQLARATLDSNWMHDHTVPSLNLYPHQWSWDSGFIAIGLACAAPGRGWRELRTLFRAQWLDGRIPHIVFTAGQSEREYFPGFDFWASTAAAGVPGVRTSGVIQPPVHALAAWEIYRRAADGPSLRRALHQLRWLYPRLVAQQNYLATHRDVGGGGLASVVHPWESGLDNSPSWDQTLARVPADLSLLRRYQRRDLRHAKVEHRPTDADYARYLGLALRYRDAGYADAGLLHWHPFLVECPGFNAIMGAAELTLARIAYVLGEPATPHLERAREITGALVDRLYDPRTGMCHALDVSTGRRSPAYCVNGLIPLILPDLPAQVRDSLLSVARSARFGLGEDMRLPLPSYDLTAPDLDRLRYWRGPVWMNTNWLIWSGLRVHAQAQLAQALRASMLDLVRRCGFFEYFHPHTGAGIGAPAFSWTAALTLHLLADEPEPTPGYDHRTGLAAWQPDHAAG